ncbi:endoribonuclease GhoS [Paraburkholderia sp. UYCP14C]|uniref:type V toxin-antitoxin system endoribonuclease antitoxin GhoS n=1 Tax=Paraburkholderia sp. UYCP14C TaxID=2511130 RepID=UPI00101EF6BA|nr:type V toxin-antitoxin system endoribonuclease antitoxin GhoS [Paraburkholderia sp. UYCP14C]RZF25448.1 endoribonuclease GhoS [Paraburkholderia sp. UYCP14C]
MAKFTVRVELHDEESGDYPKLHKQMEKRGFERTLEVNGTLLQLPDASYAYEGDKTKKEVYDKARAASDAIGRKSGIVVTKSGGRYVGGLAEA